MYSTIKDFVADWQEEAASTIALFERIDNEKLSRDVNKNVRTLGQSAWHITKTLTEMPASAGLLAEDPLKDRKIPDDMESVRDVYRKYSGELVKSVETGWKDSDLMEELEIYGQKWEKRKFLSALVKHQIHHRAQLTVVMRLLDMKVPGVYGPSKEEWTKYGMEPQE